MALRYGVYISEKISSCVIDVGVFLHQAVLLAALPNRPAKCGILVDISHFSMSVCLFLCTWLYRSAGKSPLLRVSLGLRFSHAALVSARLQHCMSLSVSMSVHVCLSFKCMNLYVVCVYITGLSLSCLFVRLSLSLSAMPFPC